MSPRRLIVVALEVVLAVAAATALVALLDKIAPITGLGVIYLLAVLAVAVRRGSSAALAAAVLSVLTLNYFFIAPVHRLTIADHENVAALGVFLVVAVVVGHLAGAARDRAHDAAERERLAGRREAEAEMLAGVASLLLRGGAVDDSLHAIAARLTRALGGDARLDRAAAPTPRGDERAVPVPVRRGRLWAYLSPAARADTEALHRALPALAALVDVADERARVAEREAEAEAAQRADVVKTALLHAVSHDLRSPLTAIGTAAAGLQAPGLQDEDREELVAVVRQEAERLARLVDDLLDLSRVEAGALHPRLDWTDLHEVVGRAAEQVPGADISIELPPDLPLVRADAAQLERVFVNLLDNAARFSPPGRPVRVIGGQGAGRVTVRVLDEGPGIPASQRPAIFEPFHRGRRGGGAGLGLAISRGFVEANGGRLLLQAPPEGRGAAFAVSLPLVAQPAARA
jgi:two-component system sensor histidine kinase KdpD